MAEQELQIRFAPSAVQMRHSRVVECAIKTNKAYPTLSGGAVSSLDNVQLSITTGFGPLADAGENVFQGSLVLELPESSNDSKQPPYFFRFVIEGVFLFSVAPPPGLDVLQVTAIHGTAALIAVARELLATLTARAPHGAVVLPSILVGRDAASVSSGLMGEPKPVKSTRTDIPETGGFTRLSFEDGKATVRMRIPLSAQDTSFVELNVVRPGSHEQSRELQAGAMEEAAAALQNLAAAVRNTANS